MNEKEVDAYINDLEKKAREVLAKHFKYEKTEQDVDGDLHHGLIATMQHNIGVDKRSHHSFDELKGLLDYCLVRDLYGDVLRSVRVTLMSKPGADHS